MAEAWLRLAKPELHGRSEVSTYSVYKFKKAFLMAEARISSRAFSISSGQTIGAASDGHVVDSRAQAGEFQGVRLETHIEFEGKIPIRKPDLYEISAGAAWLQSDDLDLSSGTSGSASANRSIAASFSLTDVTMSSKNVNRGEVETWSQRSRGIYP